MSTRQNALPPVVDAATWRRELADLRVREKAATRELDAIAAQRRRLPMVELPEYTLVGAEGPVRLAEVGGLPGGVAAASDLCTGDGVEGDRRAVRCDS